MFTTAIPETKKPIDLISYNTFEKKLNALYEYAAIRNVFVAVSNPQDIDSLIPVALNVTQLNVPLGSASYTMEVLKECHAILSGESLKYIQGEDDFNSISETLDRCIEKYNEGFEKHNLEDIFTLEQNIDIQVYKEEKWYPTLFQYVQWPQLSLYEDLKEHFNIRKGFFDMMTKTLVKARQQHHFKPDPSKKPYSWESPNPELDISELLYILYRTSNQLKIDFSAGGSFSKFKREFFTLFGLSDKDYDKKVKLIHKRKRGEHFITELEKKFTEEHAKLFTVKK